MVSPAVMSVQEACSVWRGGEVCCVCGSVFWRACSTYVLACVLVLQPVSEDIFETFSVRACARARR